MGMKQQPADEELELPFRRGSGVPERFVPADDTHFSHIDPTWVMDVFSGMRDNNPNAEPLFERLCCEIFNLAELAREEPEENFTEIFLTIGDPLIYRERSLQAYDLFERSYKANHLPSLEAAYLRLWALWTFPQLDFTIPLRQPAPATGKEKPPRVGCCRLRRHRLKLLKLPQTVPD